MKISKEMHNEVMSAVDDGDNTWAKGLVVSLVIGLISVVGLVVVLVVASDYWIIPTIGLVLAVILFIASAVIGVRKVQAQGVDMAQLGYKAFYADKEGHDTSAPFIVTDDKAVVPQETVETEESSDHIELLDEDKDKQGL